MKFLQIQISSQPNFVGAGFAPTLDKAPALNKSNTQKQGRPKESPLRFSRLFASLINELVRVAFYLFQKLTK